jgi:hypothetical protein
MRAGTADFRGLIGALHVISILGSRAGPRCCDPNASPRARCAPARSGNPALEQKPLFGSNTCTTLLVSARGLTAGRILWITAPGVGTVAYNPAAPRTTCPQ